MSCKDLLVYLDPTAAGTARLEVAVALAESHGAHLKGLPISGQSQHRKAASEAKTIGELFTQRTAAAGISSEWLTTAAGERADALIRHAHCSDLVVVGQPGGGASVPHLAQQLIMEAGRPVLVIPYAGRFPAIGSRVLVALTGGKEATRAARAVHDALPLLSVARQVALVEVVAGASAATGGKELCPDLHGHLQRHGVHPFFDRVAAGGYSVADVLLNRAFDGGFDLLVMGANIHSSTPGAGLGPVTEQILRQMTLPVLMSH